MGFTKRAVLTICPCCGGKHRIEECLNDDAPVSKAPLQVPSHNGEYQGTLPVRKLPPTASGEKLVRWHDDESHKRAANKARQRATPARDEAERGRTT